MAFHKEPKYKKVAIMIGLVMLISISVAVGHVVGNTVFSAIFGITIGYSLGIFIKNAWKVP